MYAMEFSWNWKWHTAYEIEWQWNRVKWKFSFINFLADIVLILFSRLCLLDVICIFLFSNCVNWLRACFCLDYYYFHFVADDYKSLFFFIFFFLFLFTRNFSIRLHGMRLILFCSSHYRMTHVNSMYACVCMCVFIVHSFPFVQCLQTEH